MFEVLAALGLGAVFGACLHRAGLTQYARIVGVYRLRDFTVMRFMLTALVVGACGIQAAQSLGWGHAPAVPPTLWLANLAGGAVFGVGMASAGYCPGTIVAEAGEGRLDASLAGIAGLLVGSVSYGLLQPLIMPVLGKFRSGSVTLAELLGARPWLVHLVFAELVVVLLLLPLGRLPRSK